MITLDTLNLVTADRLLTEEALRRAGTIHGAAELLGITRHALKRRIIKHGIRWARGRGLLPEPPPPVATRPRR